MAYPWTDAGVNAYMASIASSATDLNTFATDLEINFLNGLQTRFIINPTQASQILTMKPVHQSLVSQTLRMAAVMLTATSTPTLFTFSGINPSPTTPPALMTVNVSVEGGWSQATGSYVKATVSASIC